MAQDKALRDQLVKLIRGGQAFQPIEVLTKGLTVEVTGKSVPELPYTIWQLLDHMRFTLEDIVDFVRNPDYREPTWPDDYWPKEKAPADQAALDKTIASIKACMEDMIRLVQNPMNNLYDPIPHGSGQTLLREAMLVSEHNAYHLGEVVVLRRLLGDWA